jgi:glyoxylase-like metal-dependent hydrolase (beta-lactamase superfamily II)
MKSLRITLTTGAALALVGLVALTPLRAQQNAAPPALEVLPVQGNVHMLAGAGGNIAVQIGKEGVLMVDTGLAASSAQVVAEVRKLSTGPLRWIINTHLHPDHVGGNEAFAAAVNDPLSPLKIVAHENVLNRLTSAEALAAAPAVQRGLPTDEYFTPIKDIHFNGEAVVLYHEAKAHTDGDTVVLFRGSDVVATGDIFTQDAYPFIDLANGGTLQGEINAVNHILELTVPVKTQEAGTYVIPGHGRICDEADVVEFRDMLVIVRDRIQDMIRKKMTLEQVKAARPTLDYDPQYVTANSFVKTDQFVETLYKDLSRAAVAATPSTPARASGAQGNRPAAPSGRK